MIKAREILTDLTGVQPVGHRTPRWRPSKSTCRILAELGFQWNSDHMGTEKPFYNIIDGVESRLLEMPVAYILDDWSYYYDWGTPAWNVLDVWIAEFDSRYKDCIPFCLTNHPQVTGRPSRIIILEKLIEYVKSKSNIKFMKIGDYAKIHQL